MRRLARNAVVTLLVAYALAGVLAAASTLWRPAGTFGISTDYDARVRAVATAGPAALAGIVAGDRFVLPALPFNERRFVAGSESVLPIGTILHLRFVRGGVTRDVTLTAVPSAITGADRSSLLLQCLASLVFITVGASLIIIRPNRATWGFGLYCLLVLPTAAYPPRFSSSTAAFAALALYDVVQNIGVVGLLVFALEFPQTFDARWRARIGRAVPAIFLALAALTLFPDISNLIFGMGAELENRALQIVFGTVFGLAVFVLIDTYLRRIDLDERERMRWVLCGFGIGLVVNYVGNTLLFSTLIPLDPPLWISNVLVLFNVLLPLTVAHAVVRHRVFDINFVIGRALVYAALTTMLAGLFALLDWLFGSVLEDYRLSRLAEAAISIGVAFAFDSLHKRIEGATEAIFFRKRHAAETRLERLIRELPQAHAARVVAEAVTGEVVDAFDLASAALFLPNGNGTFERTASRGWSEDDCASLDDTDLLLLSLRAQKSCVVFAERPWRHVALPAGTRAPAVAVPMYSRSELAGIVLYGGHPGGADFEPAELALFERLAHAASVALDDSRPSAFARRATCNRPRSTGSKRGSTNSAGSSPPCRCPTTSQRRRVARMRIDRNTELGMTLRARMV
ncbi:MAG: hypothetical protein IAI50_17070 [Candidatus Eremiobacteraeota bacterium]|nr:hypothetical protein [Candidatus Eremiobacteraeota bacterium]